MADKDKDTGPKSFTVKNTETAGPRGFQTGAHGLVMLEAGASRTVTLTSNEQEIVEGYESFEISESKAGSPGDVVGGQSANLPASGQVDRLSHAEIETTGEDNQNLSPLAVSLDENEKRAGELRKKAGIKDAPKPTTLATPPVTPAATPAARDGKNGG